jgi:nucleoside-diphosphate-sugar epimerase
LIFPSTTSVYGPVLGVAREDCPPADLQPQSPYAAAKLAAEHAVLAADGTGGLRTVCLRFGTIFGPSAGMRFHTAVNKFVFQAATGQPLTVWREVEQLVRPYLALQDAVRAILFMLARPAAGGEIYNVVTLNAPLTRILDAIRKHVPGLQVEYTNTRLLNQVSFTVDDSKLRALGFVPNGNLEQGVADTLQLLRGLLAAGPVAP